MIVSKECLIIVSLTKSAVTRTAAKDFCWQIYNSWRREFSGIPTTCLGAECLDILLFNDKLCNDLATDWYHLVILASWFRLVSWVLCILVFFAVYAFWIFAVIINLNILEGQAGRSNSLSTCVLEVPDLNQPPWKIIDSKAAVGAFSTRYTLLNLNSLRGCFVVGRAFSWHLTGNYPGLNLGAHRSCSIGYVFKAWHRRQGGG